MYKAWRSLTFWSVTILSINPFFSLFMGASDHTFSQDVINLTVASIQIISKIIAIQGCGTRISIWSLLIISLWPVSVYVLYSIQQQKPQKKPVIFHSQGHSSSTESDLSSLIPVEIPAPVLEVFEVSANEVGAIYNSPNLQQFLMKNVSSESICATQIIPQTWTLGQLISEKTICPFCLLFLMSDAAYQDNFTFALLKKKGIWAIMSTENLVIIAPRYSWSSFCVLTTSAQLAYRDCQPTVQSVTWSHTASAAFTVTTAHFSTVSFETQ